MLLSTNRFCFVKNMFLIYAFTIAVAYCYKINVHIRNAFIASTDQKKKVEIDYTVLITFFKLRIGKNVSFLCVKIDLKLSKSTT